jgi:hypothetical protein
MSRFTFRDFYAALDKDEIARLAEAANTSEAYLYQLARGIRKPGADVSARLKRADRRITDSMLRPDLYA